MSSSLSFAKQRQAQASENPVFVDQLTFKSLLEDATDDTPDKNYKERSLELTPILSLAVDALVHSPNCAQSELVKLKLNISDFELKSLEKRVAGDLFSSAKKKYSCNFDSIALDTCSTSSERSESARTLMVYDQVFGSHDSTDSAVVATGLGSSAESPLESPMVTERHSKLLQPVKTSLRKLRLADYLDADEVSANLSSAVFALAVHLEKRTVDLAPGSGLRRNVRGAKTGLDGRFSLF